jgi:TolB-like protein/DNA-binding winged helix-turn-helix (wHTH) protein
LQHQDYIDFGPFRVDVGRRRLCRDEDLVSVPGKAFEILLELLKTPGETVTKEQLMSAVWADTFVEEGNVTQMIFLLRKALGDSESASPYIVTVPRQGYRFVGEIKVHQPSTKAWRHVAPRASTVAVVCAAVTFGIWLWARAGPGAPVQALAVLPFDDLSANKDMDYFCQGMAEELIDALSQIPGVRITSRESAAEFKKNPDVRKAGARLSAEAVLDGSVRREGDQLRVTAELIQVRDGTRMWSETYDAEVKSVFAVQRAIARAVSESLRLRVGDRPYTPPRYTSDAVLYDLYLKGRSGAPAYCQQAADRNPAYAPAFSCLADAYAGMWTAGLDPKAALARARDAAERALRLDPRLAEAHLSKARILAGNWDWTGALAEAEEAIRLAPSFGAALWFRANLLLFTGQWDDAQIAYGRAEAADPMSPGMLRQKLQSLFCMRRYDDTIAFAKQNSFELGATYYSARAYAEKGMLPEAIQLYEEYRRRSTKRMYGFGALTGLYVRAGRPDEALRILHEVNERARHSYVRPYSMAQLHTGLGDFDEGLRWLDKAYAEHDSMLWFLKIEPCWDPLRGHPRFQALLRKTNLESPSAPDPNSARRASDSYSRRALTCL